MGLYEQSASAWAGDGQQSRAARSLSRAVRAAIRFGGSSLERAPQVRKEEVCPHPTLERVQIWAEWFALTPPRAQKSTPTILQRFPGSVQYPMSMGIHPYEYNHIYLSKLPYLGGFMCVTVAVSFTGVAM